MEEKIEVKIWNNQNFNSFEEACELNAVREATVFGWLILLDCMEFVELTCEANGIPIDDMTFNVVIDGKPMKEFTYSDLWEHEFERNK